jgi:hypothetical protein
MDKLHLRVHRRFRPIYLTIHFGSTLEAMAKQVTRDQAERKKRQAAAFMERIGEPDRASLFDDMSVDEYAEHRGLELVANPSMRGRKHKAMATTREQQDQMDNAAAILNDAYTPEASREELAEAVGQALDILNGGDDDGESDEDEDEEEE